MEKRRIVDLLERARSAWRAYPHCAFYDDPDSGFSPHEKRFVDALLECDDIDTDRVCVDPVVFDDLLLQLDTLDEFQTSTRPKATKDAAVRMCLWLVAQRARRLYVLD